MLHLSKPTDDGWFSRVENHLDDILVDHAHLEKRAASTALSMIFRYTSRLELVSQLSGVVQEEMEHFDRVFALIQERGITFAKLEPAEYAKNLNKHITKQEPQMLMEKLVVAAFIEARSCERFQLLAANVNDEPLRELYSDLAISEARHHALYTKLAKLYFDPKEVDACMIKFGKLEWAALEASAGAPRLHAF